MAGIFGGGIPSQPYVPSPSAPVQDDSAQREAARKARLAGDKAIGRSGTILTDYALATQTPSTLKPTLGA